FDAASVDEGRSNDEWSPRQGSEPGRRKDPIHRTKLACCRRCHRARYVSQRQGSQGRKRLAAAKLRLRQLGGLADIREPFPPKPKWMRRTYQRIRNEIQALEAQAKTRRFRKPLSRQLFAYHVG